MQALRRWLERRPLLTHALIGGGAFAIQDWAIKAPLTSAYADSSLITSLGAFTGGMIQGTFNRYWYPGLHRAVMNASGTGTAATASAAVAGSKTACDHVAFLGLNLLGFLLFSSAAGADPHESDLKCMPPAELRVLQQNVANVPFTLESAMNTGWLLQPVMSFVLFKFVPLPLQGLAGIAQTLVIMSVTDVLRREELQAANDLIADVDEAIAAATLADSVATLEGLSPSSSLADVPDATLIAVDNATRPRIRPPRSGAAAVNDGDTAV